MDRNSTFLLYQPVLHAIAVKMVGTIEDAEDIVQDTFEKWLKIDHAKIQNTKAYLVKSVSNNCVQFLNSLRYRRTMKIDESEAELPLADDHQTRSIFNFDMEAQLQEAWTVIHARLEPLEKKLFIMREVFNIEYEELQLLVDKKKENCRQIVSRARKKLQEDTKKISFSLPEATIPEPFLQACRGEFLTDLKSF